MYTRCPTCSTCFRVTERHLAIAKGKVRCGQCQHVFNAPEHAIDDLPAHAQAINKPVFSVTDETPVTKNQIEKSTKLVQEKSSIAASSSVEENKPRAPAAEPQVTAPPAKETTKTNTVIIDSAASDADATMVTDSDTFNNDELNEIKLETHSIDDAKVNNTEIDETRVNIDEDDDLFDDSFDLNAAIDEFTLDTEESNDNIINEENSETKIESTTSDTSEENKHDVFTTDAYDATSALSVADIMSEMEGQLSLNIPEPDDNKINDINHEFDFLDTGNETTEATNHENIEDYFDLDKAEDANTDNNTLNAKENTGDEFAFIESEDQIKSDNTENKTIKAETIDEDKLFDQVDLSDFQDSEIKSSNENQAEQNPVDNHVPFQLRNDINTLQTASGRRIHPVFSFSFILLLLALLFSQVAYFRAHDLVKLVPATRPLLETFCQTLNCRYSGPTNIKQVELISRDVRLHPKEKKALLISAAIINNAHFAQPYPNIHIRLSDISGNVVAERIFNAKTYMGKLNNPFLLMKPGTPVHINFEVVDPGKDAINFEFTFL